MSRLFSSSANAALRAGHARERLKKMGFRARLDYNHIVNNLDEVAANMQQRGVRSNLDDIKRLVEQEKNLSDEISHLNQRKRQVSKQTGQLMARLKKTDLAQPTKEQLEQEKENLFSQGHEVKKRLQDLHPMLEQVQFAKESAAYPIPNNTHPDVPIGGEENASLVRTEGTKQHMDFPARDHIELGRALEWFDTDSAVEVSGSRFAYLKNEAALLECALTMLVMNRLHKAGFTPVMCPDLVRPYVLEACGFHPREDESVSQVYTTSGHDLCLTGTAEVPLAAMHMNQILSAKSFPLKYAGGGHSFRTEIGHTTSETRGIYRTHQFSKVEMFAFCRPDQSEDVLREMMDWQVELYSDLGLHFRVLDMPTEELGNPAHRKYDIEAWMPGRAGGVYGEISSTSNCTDYQARRLNIRYKHQGSGGIKNEFVHTLNGTAVAIPRVIVSILEQNQQADGSVLIPELLQPLVGVERVEPRNVKELSG